MQGARCCGTRVRARAFDRASFDAHAGPVRCRRAVPRSSDSSTVAARGEYCGECCWEEAVCVERTELVQLQRPPNVCMLVHARAWTKTRGNPDRGMRVPLGQGCCSEPCGDLLTELLSPGGRKRLMLRMPDKVSETAAGLSA